MDAATTRLTVDKQVNGYWRVTLNHPPINTVDDLMYVELMTPPLPRHTLWGRRPPATCV